MTAPEMKSGVCVRCGQVRPLFDPRPEWGRVKGPVCSTDWQAYADARANDTFVDWDDAFANATDEQLEEQLSGRLP